MFQKIFKSIFSWKFWNVFQWKIFQKISKICFIENFKISLYETGLENLETYFFLIFEMFSIKNISKSFKNIFFENFEMSFKKMFQKIFENDFFENFKMSFNVTCLKNF